MSLNTLVSTHPRNALGGDHIDANLMSFARYTGGDWGGNIAQPLQSNQPKNTLQRSASTQASTSAISSSINKVVTLNGRFSRKDSLSVPYSRSDVYKVILPRTGSFNVGITGLSKNANPQLLTLNNRLIASSNKPGNSPEAINLNRLAAGTYFVKVTLQSWGKTDYQIMMSRSSPSNILAEDSSLPTIEDQLISRTGTLSDRDTSDIYRFNLEASSNLNFELSDPNNKANMRLVKDINQNGWIDANDVIAFATEAGSTAKSMSASSLDVGQYFLQVHQQGSGSASYSLEVTRSQPAPLTFKPVADAYIRNDLSVRENDNYGSESLIAVGTGRDNIQGWGAADAMRSLIRFDLSGVSGTVKQATLRLNVYGFSEDQPHTFNVGVYKVTESWEEGNGMEGFTGLVPGSTNTDDAFGVSWSAIDANNQAQPSFIDSAIVTQAIDTTLVKSGDIVEWDITSLVQAWVQNPGSNYGLVLRDVTTDGTFRELRFGSREADLYDFPVEVPGPELSLQLQ